MLRHVMVFRIIRSVAFFLLTSFLILDELHFMSFFCFQFKKLQKTNSVCSLIVISKLESSANLISVTTSNLLILRSLKNTEKIWSARSALCSPLIDFLQLTGRSVWKLVYQLTICGRSGLLLSFSANR